MSQYDFTNQNIDETFQRVLQITDEGYVVDGTGSFVDLRISGSLFATSSNAMSASFSSYAVSCSYALSASYEINYETSSSYADFAVSSSYAQSSSFSLSSTSSSYALSGSHAVTSSYTLSNLQTITENGNITTIPITGSSLYIDDIQFRTNHTHSPVEGQLCWNDDDKTLNVGLAQGSILQVGQEQLIRVANKSGADIENGKLVYISGSQGNRPTIWIADYSIEHDSDTTIGMVTTSASIENNNNGYVCTSGIVHDVNTSAYIEGTLLFLSSSGNYTNIEPIAPYHMVPIGTVLKQHAKSGEIFIRVNLGFEISELHDVIITSPIGNDIIYYDSSSIVWRNKQPDYTLSSSFNAFTASYATDSSSFNTSITSLRNATGSYVLNSQTSSMSVMSSSYALSSSYTTANLQRVTENGNTSTLQVNLGALVLGTGSVDRAPLKFQSGDLLASSIAGNMEYEADDLYFSIASALPGTVFTSVYPPAYSDTYVKATTKYSTDFWPYFATNPALSLIGTYNTTSWIGGNGFATNQRFHIDLGSAQTAKKVYYENQHFAGTLTDIGVKNFTLWGSNEASAFAELTYGTDTNWTQLTTDVSQFSQHSAADAPDPKYINVTNATAYRYYAFKFADNWGFATLMGVRRIELQTGDPIYRRGIILNDGTNLTSGSIPVATNNGRLVDGISYVSGIMHTTSSYSLYALSSSYITNSYITDSTIINNITTPSNWVLGTYIGTTSGIMDRQEYLNSYYRYSYLSGSLIRSKIADGISTYSIESTASINDSLIFCNSTVNIKLYLPAGNLMQFNDIRIKNIATGSITVSSSVATMDGEYGRVIEQYQTLSLRVSGSNYFIL